MPRPTWLSAVLITCALSLVLALGAALPALAQSARLDGRVTDPDGRPVAGADVRLAGPAGAERRATTDADGRFDLGEVPAGVHLVTAVARGLSGDARVDLRRTPGASVDLRLRPAAVSEAIVVSAAQVDQPLSRTPDSVSVIAGAELAARQIGTLGEALAGVPGFSVARSGGPGTLTSLFPRGGESDFTLVLVDGVRANSFGGGLDLSQVPLADVDRVEVVRGPQSALYGSDAIGGVVQIVTRTGGPPSLAGAVEAGGRGTRRVSGSTTGSLGPVRWNAGGDHLADDGYTGRAPASGEPVTNDDARRASASATVGWRHARGTDLAASFAYVETDRGAPGPYGSDPAGRFFGVDRVSRGATARRTFGLRVVQPWFGPASRVRQRIDVDVADYDLTFVSPFGVSATGTARAHARVQTDVAAAAALGVSAGLEWLDERGTSTFITAGSREVPIDRRVVGVFAEARWTGHARASATAGLRAEHIRRDALEAHPSPFSPRPAFAPDVVSSINPKVAVSWRLTSTAPSDGARAWTRLRAAAGTGIRPPDAFEIAFTDNPSLRPERSRSMEAGVTQALAAGALQIDGTFFINAYDDLIVSVGRLTAASRFRTDNISNARARGLELSAAWRHRLGVSARAGYTYLQTEIRDVDGVPGIAPAPYRVGDPLLRRPRHQFSGGVLLVRGRVSAFADLTARGRVLDAEPAWGPSGGLFPNPAHAVTSAGGAWRLGRAVEVYGRVSNLFDATYEEVLGYPAPGRLAFVGVRLAAAR
ncbi:MAG: TonB-dependent receptor [Acidobacteriota bacterium]